MSDRRKHFRLMANFPLDVVLPSSCDKKIRRVSANVSAGGIYFHGHCDDRVLPGQKIGLRIAIPPAVGRFADQGILEGEATVIRVDPVETQNNVDRFGIACEFSTPLRFG